MTFLDTNPKSDQYGSFPGSQTFTFFRDSESPSQARLANAQAKKIEESLFLERAKAYGLFAIITLLIFGIGIFIGKFII